MLGYVWIVDPYEHTAEVVPATFYPVFLPKLSEGTLGVRRETCYLFSRQAALVSAMRRPELS